MIRSSFLIILILSLISCKHELESPTWEVDMIVPLANLEMNITNIIEDNDDISINLSNDSLISLIFTTDILNVNLDTLIKIDAITDEQTHTLDSASFDDVSISDTATIGQAITEIPFGTVLFPNGSTSTIPDIPNIINEDTVDIDASEYFETMTLYQGMLIIEIINGYPTDISNVSMSLINATNLNTIGTFSFPLIESGSSAIDSVSIAGQTLDENIVGILHNMDINASNGSVPINYEDAIITNITIADIGITQATAIFPEQQLTENLKEHSFDFGTAQIKEIGIKSGNVKVNVLSTLPNGKMIYNIPSLKKNGIPFTSGDMIVPQATSTEVTTFEFDFSGYILDLTGKENRIGGDTINTIYTEAYTFIDSTGELVTINQTDSFYSYIEFDLTPEYGIGYLGQEIFTIGPTISENDLFNNITDGSLDLEEAYMNIRIENFIGTDASIIFNEFSAENTNDNNPPVNIGTDQYNDNIIGKEYVINRALLSNGNTPIESSITEINLEASNILEILPNQITIGAILHLNPNGQNLIHDDFIYPSHTVNASIDTEIPLSLISNNLTVKKIIDLDINNNEDLEVDELYINIKNGFPLSSVLDIILLDEYNNIIDTLLNGKIITSAINNNNIVISPSETNIIINDTDFTNVKKIEVIAAFSTSSITEHVKIYNYHTIDVSLSAKFREMLGN